MNAIMMIRPILRYALFPPASCESRAESAQPLAAVRESPPLGQEQPTTRWRANEESGLLSRRRWSNNHAGVSTVLARVPGHHNFPEMMGYRRWSRV